MKALSGNSSTSNKPKPVSSHAPSSSSSAPSGGNSFMREEAKKKENDIGNAVSGLLGDGVSTKLEQDKFEGVEEKEWVSFPIDDYFYLLKLIVLYYFNCRASKEHSFFVSR